MDAQNLGVVDLESLQKSIREQLMQNIQAMNNMKKQQTIMRIPDAQKIELQLDETISNLSHQLNCVYRLISNQRIIEQIQKKQRNEQLELERKRQSSVNSQGMTNIVIDKEFMKETNYNNNQFKTADF